MSLLEARGITHTYPGDVHALNRLDLHIERGRRLAILGANGSGKTTLLLHLNGTLRPHVRRGPARRRGRCGYDAPSLIAWRSRVGLVLQNADDQLFAPSVGEDVSFGPLNLDLSEAETRQRVDSALARAAHRALADRATHMLSFGQKKRVAIAGLVAMQPEILLLDEPTAGLDHQGTEDLLAVLEGSQRQHDAGLHDARRRARVPVRRRRRAVRRRRHDRTRARPPICSPNDDARQKAGSRRRSC